MSLTDEQKACVQTLDRSLVVAAGAGSGKTFTLTQRIASALEHRFIDDIGEVCAITFTKKAAGELKSRIKGELRARGLIDQALKVDEAWISTIHSMCARILRAHALELGIDPAFRGIEQDEVEDYLVQAVENVLVEAEDSRSERVDALFREYAVRSFGGRGDSVEAMLNRLVAAATSCAEGVDAFVMPGITVDARRATEAAVATMEELLELASGENPGAKHDAWVDATEGQLARARKVLADASATPAELLAAVSPFSLKPGFGKAAFKERLAEAKGEVSASVMEIRLGMAREHLETLVELARRACGEYARLKHADGVLDNNDLLVLAARALEEHPALAARYSDKFKLVMVDEFQDTDQMQVDMIKRISGEGSSRLCTVGDAQQSIYRFRGADVSVYRRHLKDVETNWGKESVIKLAENFRSHEDVLKFVDCVFGQADMFDDEFMTLSAGRKESDVASPLADDCKRIVVQHTSTVKDGPSSDLVRERAAQRIAAEFARLRDAGHSPGDMVLLLGSMPHSEIYARAFREVDLPCVISGGSVFASSNEAKLVRALVRVIANPRETQSLFNVLVGPIFGLTAGDLLRCGGIDNFWEAAASAGGGAGGTQVGHGEAMPTLTCAFSVLSWAREAAGSIPVSGILERVAVDSGWLSRLEQLGAEGLASAGNVFKAIRMVRSIEEAGAFGPASVMRRFDAKLESSKEAPGALSVSGGESVRIMTVHASKGLEFPIVAIAEFKEERASSDNLLAVSVGGKVYLSLDLDRSKGDFALENAAMRNYVLGEAEGEIEIEAAVVEGAGALSRRLALKEREVLGDCEEAKRLLYVAITRAKEAVIVSTQGRRTKHDQIGYPKSVFRGVFTGLDPLGGKLGAGTTLVEFGGSLPALVEIEALDCCDGEGGCSGRVRSADDSKGGRRGAFMVPVVEERRAPELETWRPLREGVFSYSSIADASHEGDLLGRLADAFAVSVDEPVVGAGSPQVFEAVRDSARSFADGGENPFRAFDEDRATNLGTAFHRLAQFAVVARGDGGALAMPPDERVEALTRSCELDGVQRARLDAALERWFGCGLAREMAELPELAAEVPFLVSVGDAFLEGEIDLLGFDAERAHARVVDYKTGGSATETADDLQRKHVLQAACYAYAVLLQGARAVDVAFVRVEQPRADACGEPQCVRYRFEAGNAGEFRNAIAEVYALA